jgi:hypothetical protein
MLLLRPSVGLGHGPRLPKMARMPVTRLDPDVAPEVREGSTDGDEYAHYAKREEIARASVLGGKITALCGWEFEPVRDPSRYPVCQRCKELVALAEDLS